MLRLFSSGCGFSMKVMASAVTALSVMLESPAYAQSRPEETVPLTLELTGFAETCLDHAALASMTGLQILPARASKEAWRVRAAWSHGELSVTLWAPDGTPLSSKQIALTPPESPCKAAAELVAVLLAAHVAVTSTGEAVAATPPSQGSDTQAPTSEPVPAAAVDTTRVWPSSTPRLRAAAAQAGAPESNSVWRVSAGLGMAFLPAQWQGVVGGTYRVGSAPLAVGLEVAGFRHNARVEGGDSTVESLGVRFLPGLVKRSGRLQWEVNGLGGVRLSHGKTHGLAQTGSADILSLELGGRVAAWWIVGRQVSLGLLAGACWLVPTPGFAVAGANTIYEPSRPAFELVPAFGWEN